MAQRVKNPPAIQETQETCVWSLGWEDPLEDEMATHSSVLAWKIPWTEEPGGLQSMDRGAWWAPVHGSQRVGHDWATNTHTSCLYILEINPLSVASFAIIFSHSEGYLFILYMVSSAVQKLLSLIRPHLFIFIYFHYSRRWIIEELGVTYVIECSSYVFL